LHNIVKLILEANWNNIFSWLLSSIWTACEWCGCYERLLIHDRLSPTGVNA